MKRIIVLLALSVGLSMWFIKGDLHIRAWASASGARWKPQPLTEPGSSGQVSVHAAGRGNPVINLRDGRDLKTAYSGSAELKSAFEPARSTPLALAVGDFDEDGVPDVIGGYAQGRLEAGSSVLALYKGNCDSIYPNSREAQNHKISGAFTDAPFLPSATVIDVSEPPDYLGAGDFDADGHLDIAVAAVRGESLYVLSGDGRGGFRSAKAINLPGRVTALATGEINRADGLTDIVVGIEGGDGPNLMVFEGPRGAFNANPEVFQLPAEATTLALAQLDDDYPLDLAVGAGSDLLVLHGRDRKLSLDTTRRSEVQPAIVSRQSLSVRVQSLAVGNFSGNDQTDIAMLTEDGQVIVLERTQDGSAARKPEDAKYGNATWIQGSALSIPGSRLPVFAARSLLVSAPVSSLPTDDLVLLDRSNDQLHVLTSDAETKISNSQAIASTSFVRSLSICASLDVEGEPVAVVPMRLNTDALSDLVILRKGAPSLTVTTSAALSTITVNDTADTNIRDSVLTLREAIMLAEGTLLTSSLTVAEQAQVSGTPAAAQEDEIRFNVPGAGVHTINPIPTGLPSITAAGGSLTIDGTTQPGFTGMPLIELNGTGVTATCALVVDAGSSTVRGLVINRFSNGIQINANGNDVFEGNFIGTDATGSAGTGNSNTGIFIAGSGSPNTRIGGTTAAARNIISSNNGGGIAMFSSTGIIIQGNFIGTNVTGTAILGNNGSGIRVSSNNNNTTIGGTAAGALNLISGNIGTGLQIDSSNTGNMAQGNLIGTDITGTLDFGNLTGIAIGSNNNTIGGTTAAARNLISGNNANAILLNGGGANANLVQGNFIGTDASGTADLGNNIHGVDINFGSGNTIGGTTTGAGNLISGNNIHGINLGGSGNFVQGNLIGTQQNGTSPLGNTLVGVAVALNNNAIGGTDPGAANIIAFNGDDGVQVSGGSGHAIRHNSIFSNGSTIQHLGIDLGVGGVNANDDCDPDAGANNLQNFPVITSASTSAGSITIAGTLNSTAGTTFTIDFFANQSCDGPGNGEGQTFLGSTTVTTAAASCNTSFNFTTGAPPAGQNVVTATATDPSGNTSEFSQCITVPAECTITCPQNQTVNTGPGATQCGATVAYPAPTTSGSCGTVTCTPSSGSFFAKGTTTVNCATSAGPSCSFTVTVVDNTAPTITCPANITQNNDPNQCSAVVTYTTPAPSDNCPGATAMCTPAAGSTFPKGVTTVTCTATDSSNNTAPCSFTVTVNDTQVPAITCPSDTTTSTSTSCAVVNYPAATVSDNCAGSTASCSPPSGTCFPAGATTVNCTASDASGNQASCSFTVTVNQTTTNCSITCPPNIAKSNDPNQCGAVVTYSAPVTTGTCGTVICSPASGSFFPVGTTTVSCRSNSGAGPEMCTFNVTVVDTQPPAITCPSNISAAGAISCPFATTSSPVNFAVTASDNCGGATVVCKNQNNVVVTSGSTFPVGTTTVTCTASDPSGNTATCSFNVTGFSGCLQDESNPNTVVLFNVQTGQYQFCCNGTLFTGTGTVTVKGCVVTIQHNKPDRRVLIGVEGNANVGTASLQSPPGTIKCTIRDRDTRNNSCVCR